MLEVKVLLRTEPDALAGVVAALEAERLQAIPRGAPKKPEGFEFWVLGDTRGQQPEIPLVGAAQVFGEAPMTTTDSECPGVLEGGFPVLGPQDEFVAPGTVLIATESCLANSPVCEPATLFSGARPGTLIPVYNWATQLYSVGVSLQTGRLYIQGHRSLCAPGSDGVPTGYRVETTHYWTDLLERFLSLPEGDPLKQAWSVHVFAIFRECQRLAQAARAQAARTQTIVTG